MLGRALASLCGSVILAGCTPAYIVVNVDPELAEHAAVYDVKRADRFWLEDQLNVSFGPYRVADMDVGWIRERTIEKKSEIRTDTSLFSVSEAERQWLGVFSVLYLDPHLTVTSRTLYEDRVTQKMRYRFESGGFETWTARCACRASYERTETHYIVRLNKAKERNDDNPVLSGYRYACVYSSAGKDDWVLSITGEYLTKLEVSLKHGDTTYSATLTVPGQVVAKDRPDIKPYDVLSGYYWVANNEKRGALANYAQKIPQIWLRHDNGDETNQGLAMASTGLLFFHWIAANAAQTNR
jgi:hypothetical protein